MTVRTALVVLALTASLACERREAAPAAKPLPPAVARFVLLAEPAGSTEIVALKRTVKTGDAVVVHGRFQEFNDTLASFRLVDAALPACGEEEGVVDTCSTPWDFCCEPDLADHLVNVELRGDDGAPVAAALRGAGGFDHLEHAIVVGTAEVDGKGNVTIAANGVFLGGGASRAAAPTPR